MASARTYASACHHRSLRFRCGIEGDILETDDSTDEKEGIGSVQEPEAAPKKRRAAKSAPDPDSAANANTAEGQAKKRRKPRHAADKKSKDVTRQEHEPEKVEEPAAAEAAAEGVPGGQRIDVTPSSNVQPEGRAETAPERDQTPIESTPVQASGDGETHEGAEPAQKLDLSSEEHGVMESGWKFDEKSAAEPSPERGSSKETDEEPNETAAERETDSQFSAGAPENETGYRTPLDGQAVQKSVVERQSVKHALIALAVVAAMYILVFYALNHGGFKSTVPTNVVLKSVSTTTVPKTAVQISNVIANAVTGRYPGNSMVFVSGAVSPQPGSANSAVSVTITGPRGVEVNAAQAPVSASGRFNLSYAVGNNNWPNGVYTVTSNYYSASSVATFSFAAASGAASVSNEPSNMIVSALCTVYLTVHSVIFLLSIVLVVLGAAVYAFGHVMPGQHKGTVQGYGMGMVIGGIVGSLIAVLVPSILKMIAGGTLPIASCISGFV